MKSEGFFSNIFNKREIMYLNLVYTLLPHPYPYELISLNEKWSEFKLEVLNHDMKLVKTIFHIQWDICVFLKWILDNEEKLKKEIAPIEISSDFIAKGIYEFYDNSDENSDIELLDRIFQYKTRHGIVFALRGIKVDDVYIGLYNGRMTISFYDDHEYWNYDINSESFFHNIKVIMASISVVR